MTLLYMSESVMQSVFMRSFLLVAVGATPTSGFFVVIELKDVLTKQRSDYHNE